MHYSLMHSCTMDGPLFLQALLDLRGLNPNSMAKKAGNHALQSTVARFLGGNQSRRSTMQPVADFFGVDVGGFYDPDKARMELERLSGVSATHPTAALTPSPAPGAPAITLAQALEVVAGALSSVPVDKRQALLGVLATYASDPVQESNSLSYLQSELAKTQARAGVHPSSIATGQPPGGKV